MSSFGTNGEQKRSVSQVLDRLNEARHRQFVGREEEKAIFESIINATELPIILLYIYGPGGVGKSSLLQEFSYIARQANLATVYVDVRDVQPTPDAFTDALKRAMARTPPPASPASSRQIILIDTYEKICPLDSWLRDSFLPHLPANTLVVMAGRQALPPRWRSDVGWRTLIREISLRYFSPTESHTLLTRQGIPPARHQAIFEFTHGHPLALSLIGDKFAQSDTFLDEFEWASLPDVVKTLLDRFIEGIPGPTHRAALEACAQVRLMSEPLLAAMLETPAVQSIFEWLRDLSFVESDTQGLRMHEVAANALAADLRWRNSDLYETLFTRARTYYEARLPEAYPEEQQRIIADYIFLRRHHPIIQPFVAAYRDVPMLADTARESDWPGLLAMVDRHEGRSAAEWAAHWFKQQPHNILVVRSTEPDTNFDLLGFFLALDLSQADAQSRTGDPATQATWDYLHENAPLRSGERATLFRFWMTAESHQDFSPVQALIGVHMVRHYLTTPKLAYSFFPCADPDFWASLCTYANLVRLPEADYVLDGRHFGVYGHDWRVTPPLRWLDLLAGRDHSPLSQQAPPSPAAESLIVLSRSEFTKAVREAFRHLATPDILPPNPLLRSHMVVKVTGSEAATAERLSYLQSLLIETSESLQGSPRETKFYRALYHTYIQPAPTQEKAAELLDLPFSTFRRHLKAGLDYVVDLLWQKEIGQT